ncbi:hypothetical protein FA15DRAFT_717113, partial [Coprinopsis marcescibilis]
RWIKDVVILLTLIFMLIWPWVLWAIVYDRQGIKANKHIAKHIAENPQIVFFVVTLIAAGFRTLLAQLFSSAITRYARERIVRKDLIEVNWLTTVNALRDQEFKWSWREYHRLFQFRGLYYFTQWVLTMLAFYLVVPGLTSILYPTRFERSEKLQGMEFDMSSRNPDCISWIDSATQSLGRCDLQSSEPSRLTNCFNQGQLFDILASSRARALGRLSREKESLSLSFFRGQKGPLRILGPLRGVLPLGPNGIKEVNDGITPPATLNDPGIMDRISTYSYTLDQQGLLINMNCQYDSQSPIRFGSAPDPSVHIEQYTGACPEATDFMLEQGVPPYVTPTSNHSLAAWACRSSAAVSQSAMFNFYLQGHRAYAESIGNITCTLGPVRLRAYRTTYSSESGLFSVDEDKRSDPFNASVPLSTTLIERGLTALAGVVHGSQHLQSNMLAEFATSVGVDILKYPPPSRNYPTYLPVYAEMLSGILEYHAAYTRFVSSITEDRPESCVKEVSGTLRYTIGTGWYAAQEGVWVLVPVTIINILAIWFICRAMVRAWQRPFDLKASDKFVLDYSDLIVGYRLGRQWARSKNLVSWGHKIDY